MILEAARSNDRQARGDWGITNDIRADPHGFTGVYVSVEKDTVAYGSGTWVRTHDTWVLREGVTEPPQKYEVCLPTSYRGILDEARMRKHTQIRIQYQI
jgi:hypothetical protein